MPRKSPPDDETKENRFKRMAEFRVTSALEKIRLIENLSNKSIYQYMEGDIEKIFNKLEERIKEARTKFRRKGREEFRL